ncbi:MAG: thiamine diphosphokinase [Porphyromonas sp.]|nr:thiamine diphosphokinase [Bacteroidales bacterium]MDY3100930.1 thiamine diphosphokinase [Porphyromonas sp.]
MKQYNVIVANGILPRTRKMINLIEDAEHVIVCDGAVNNYFSYTKRLPDYVIGDGDSLDKDLVNQWHIPFIKVEDQETNDLTKAVFSGKEHGWDNFLIVGATGGRDDHAIANIFLLGYYVKIGVNVRMICPKGEFIPVAGHFDERVGSGRVVSIFPVDHSPVTATGLVYPVINRTFNELWEGTLNKTKEDRLVIDSEGRFLVFLGKRPAASALESR